MQLPLRVIHYNKLGAGKGIKIERLQKREGIDNHLLQKGDILVEFNGSPVDGIDSLQRCLSEETIGIKATLGILRKGIKEEVEVIPGELSGSYE